MFRDFVLFLIFDISAQLFFLFFMSRLGELGSALEFDLVFLSGLYCANSAASSLCGELYFKLASGKVAPLLVFVRKKERVIRNKIYK